MKRMLFGQKAILGQGCIIRRLRSAGVDVLRLVDCWPLSRTIHGSYIFVTPNWTQVESPCYWRCNKTVRKAYDILSLIMTNSSVVIFLVSCLTHINCS